MSAPITLSEKDCGIEPPVIAGEHVVWAEETVAGARTCGHKNLLTRQIGDETTTELASPVEGFYLDAGGDIVVYTDADRDELIAVDLVSGDRTIVHDPDRERGDVPATPSDPTTDGRYVFWTQPAGENEETGGGLSDLWGYDLETNQRFIVSDVEFNFAPHINGGGLVWRQWHGPDGEQAIYAMPMSEVIP